MEYYKLLQLKREPFSNSPDPDYFFQSRQHHACLQKLELALRLKRGLNVVIGEVGTGKTTLCRELIRRFATDEAIETHLVLDPSFDTATELLTLLYNMFCQRPPASEVSAMTLKEHIKQALYTKGVEQKKTVVLIIDEGQKISSTCVEILRELLNFETNNFKLLQIAIFAQQEFDQVLSAHENFSDRINLLHHLGPLSFSDTRRMIHHRIKLSSQTAKPRTLFTIPAQWAIYRASRGYPRKIVHLCHQCILAMIIQNRTRAGWSLVRSSRKRTTNEKSRWVVPLTVATSAALVAAIVFIVQLPPLNEQVTSAAQQRYLMPRQVDPETIAVSQSETIQVLPVAVPSPPPSHYPEGPPSVEIVSTDPSAVISPTDGIADQAAVEAPFSSASRFQEQPSTEKPEEVPTNISPPPAILGELSVKPGDTLLRLVRTVYGTATNRFMRAVIDANPQIENPNAIDLDDVIRFPAIPIEGAQLGTDYFQVVIDRADTLSEARHRQNDWFDNWNQHLKLMVIWLPDRGVSFQLVCPKRFSTEMEAQHWLTQNSEKPTHSANIQHGYPDGVLFYTAP